MGSPVTAFNVRIGVPIDPNATGAVLASRHAAAACNGGKPRPESIAADTATGVPNPAAPSMKAPNANAMRSAWRRRSDVRLPTESLRISNAPVSRVIRYSRIAQ
jgi:hypothetical protein